MLNKPPIRSYAALVHSCQDQIQRELKAATQQPDAALASLYILTCGAFRAAVELSKMRIWPEHLTLGQFAGQAASLQAYHEALEKLSGRMELLRRWPKDPGVAFSWKAGASALDVAGQFAHTIGVAVAWARTQSSVSLRHPLGVDLQVSDPVDTRISVWRQKTLEEIKTRLLPDAWTPTEFHRDVGVIFNKLMAEYERTKPSLESFDSAYLPASKILADHDRDGKVLTNKRLQAILKIHSEIRRHKPNKQRLTIHIGDWLKFYNNTTTSDDGWATEAEVEKNKAAMAARKQAGN